MSFLLLPGLVSCVLVFLWHLAESKQVALFFEAFASQLVFLYLVLLVH